MQKKDSVTSEQNKDNAQKSTADGIKSDGKEMWYHGNEIFRRKITKKMEIEFKDLEKGKGEVERAQIIKAKPAEHCLVVKVFDGNGGYGFCSYDTHKMMIKLPPPTAENTKISEPPPKTERFKRIDFGLRKYYEHMGKEYTTTFLEYCEENGFNDDDEKDFQYQINNVDDCYWLDFDEENFPLKEVEIGRHLEYTKQMTKEQRIHDIIKNCYAYGYARQHPYHPLNKEEEPMTQQSVIPSFVSTKKKPDLWALTDNELVEEVRDILKQIDFDLSSDPKKQYLYSRLNATGAQSTEQQKRIDGIVQMINRQRVTSIE